MGDGEKRELEAMLNGTWEQSNSLGGGQDLG